MAATVMSAELAEAQEGARVLRGPNGPEIAADWCMRKRPDCFMDAYEFAGALAETLGGFWYDVLDVFETRRIRACQESKVETPQRAPYRPVPGKPCVEMVQNRIVTVKGYGTDCAGEYVEVQLAGSYGAHVRFPLSCIRPLTDEERGALSVDADTIISQRKKGRRQ